MASLHKLRTDGGDWSLFKLPNEVCVLQILATFHLLRLEDYNSCARFAPNAIAASD